MSISSVSVKARALACFIAGACFLLPNLAYAKSDDSKLASYEKKVADTDTYGNCSAASQAISKYKGTDCSQSSQAYQNAQKALDNICNIYKDIKSEYKKCTSGEMDKSKQAYETLSAASTAEKTCENSKSSILSEIDTALSNCKKAKSAQDKADKADAKADKAAAENAEAQQALQNAESAYNTAVQNCENGDSSACSQMKSLYKTYESAAKKAGKTAKAEQKAFDNAESKNQAAQTANEKAASCSANQHYDAVSNSCITDTVEMGNATGEAGEVVVTGQSKSMDETLEQEKNEAKGYTDTRCKSIDKSGEDHGTFGIFNYLACKITTVVADIRAIVYVLAGFGMIAFAYGAIIGKINFKQLANIFIGLFILSMTTGFIEAVVFNDGTSRLTYGDFLPNGNHDQFNSVTANCANNASLCPDVALAGMENDAKNSSFSASDLKHMFSSAKSAIKTASDTYKTVKNTVDTAVNAAENIGNAIKNGGDITEVVSNIAANVSNVVNTTNMAANQLSNAASSITGDLRDMTSTADQIAYREELEKQYNILKGKCDTGNCSENEKASLANMAAKVEENKTSTDKWLENDGKGGGSTLLAGLGKAAEISNQANQVTSNVAKAKNEGEGLAGGTLGTILGVGYAATEAYTSGSDAYNEMNKDGGALDFRSAQTKAQDDAAEAAAAAQKACLERKDGTWTWDGKQCTSKDKNGNLVVADLTSGTKTMTKQNEDGSTSTYTQTLNADGSLTTSGIRTDKDGNVSSLGSKTTKGDNSSVYSDGNSNVRTDAYGNTFVNGRNEAADSCANKGGHWDPETGNCTLSSNSQAEENCKKKGGTLDPKTKDCIVPDKKK